MTHGTTNGYDNYKCRCNDCKAAKAARSRRYRSTDAGKQKEREANARRRRADRDEIQAIKLAAQCMDCDEIFDDPSKLEFDHRDPDSKLFNVGHGVNSASRADLYAEIEKCDVVCNACHIQRGKARGQYAEAGRKSAEVRRAS